MSASEITDAAYISAARRLWHKDGEVEIDEGGPKVSRHDDWKGAYVQAWVWVPTDAVDRPHDPAALHALIGAVETLTEWHEHACGCPLAEVEPKPGAACDCGLDAARAALAKVKEGAR